MNNISFTAKAWEEYCYWQTQDKKTLKRINSLLADIIRNKFEGIGKPEPLKDNLSGFWSRRIDKVNRLVYKVDNNKIEIIQCKGHTNNYMYTLKMSPQSEKSKFVFIKLWFTK